MTSGRQKMQQQCHLAGVIFLPMNEYVIDGLRVDMNITNFIAHDLHFAIVSDSNTWQFTNHATALRLLTLYTTIIIRQPTEWEQDVPTSVVTIPKFPLSVSVRFERKNTAVSA